ncbi:metal-dependent hydrolase [Xenorhabdus nematophila]|uniref:LexA regulated gene, SOS response n=1 Tax=Xenorhabdus nematophila (strain ATCC 19061 / DSM 3370 / CCUG 14189 / LMG 1036 / NCIMB 9965 / AN6) TaxID=406817 RepID=D3VD06_XENNA|nr:metal-dependent hydrolase [Xenorhabdus nematophila]CEE94007.1 putative LexA regulated gene, SOS response [Xenorhabdus nematophila str. Anatoliense]CEF33760.1 putative LexA regulated gene, SOS response [Xenorhabdus nematophila str. Websteri]AYA40468.1 metal-dependent hydrolase [Xenorhabdus nematophila]KHD28496.1 hydrolase [Xenorhabdus nematophila]MBA0019202.1 metal-dependent hydrolase [Xenorhabdus nematophila]
MTAQGHLLFSVASLVLAHQLEITPEIAQGDWLHMLPGVLLASLLPDIDHPSSTLGRLFRFISIPIAKLCGHRGFTHSLLALIVGMTLFQTEIPSNWPIPTDFIHAMVVGYISHLIADMLTPAGIPLLWPLRTRFCIPIIRGKERKKAERFIAVLVLVIAIILPQYIDFSFTHYFDKLSFDQLSIDKLQNLYK